MATQHFKRRRKLIKRGLQLRLTGLLAGISLLCFGLQLLMVQLALSDAANALPSGNAALQGAIPGILWRTLLMSVLVFLPLIALVGVSATFRIAGPVYRFEQHLRSVAAGEQTGPCKIREGDELHELCDAINNAIEPLRARDTHSAQTSEAA